MLRPSTLRAPILVTAVAAGEAGSSAVATVNDARSADHVQWAVCRESLTRRQSQGVENVANGGEFVGGVLRLIKIRLLQPPQIVERVLAFN